MSVNYIPKINAPAKVSVKLPEITKTAKANLKRKLMGVKRKQLGSDATPSLGTNAKGY